VLSQIVSMTVFIRKDLVNYENIDSVHSLFALSHAFGRTLPEFVSDTTIIMREVGIAVPRGKKRSLNEKDKLHRRSDVTQRISSSANWIIRTSDIEKAIC
jgi:hypothetical protein